MANRRDASPVVRVSRIPVPAELFWSGVVVIILGVLGFGVLAMNLGDGDVEAGDVRSQFRSFVEAMADGAGEKACGMLQEGIAESFAERAALNLGVEPAPCPEMVAAFEAERPTQWSTDLRGVEILEVRMIGGDAATAMPPESAEVDIDAGTITLQRASGCAGSPDCWLVYDAAPVFRLADPTWEG